MGVQTDVVIADLSDAQAVAETATPTSRWQGFTFNGFDHVKLCTLLSLLKTGSPSAAFHRFLSLVKLASAPAEEGPVVLAVRPEQVVELAAVAALGDDEFESLALAWEAADEFAAWSASGVRNLLRELGDLADAASLQRKCLLLWQSL